MQWLIQSNDLPDNQTKRLLETVLARNMKVVKVGFIPFSHEITGLEEADLDPRTYSYFYGSVQLVQKLYEMGKHNWIFYQPNWFWPATWIGKRTDFLNEKQKIVSVGSLRSKWVQEPTFIKPCYNPTHFKGQVLEPEKEDHDNWLIEHSHLDDGDLIVASPVQKIEKEWRFFVLDHEVVTGSLYKRDGYLCTKEPILSETWYRAEEAAMEWLPNKDIVMDIALLRSGEYKVVEFNCFNSSGFYNCDLAPLLDHLEARNVNTVNE